MVFKIQLQRNLIKKNLKYLKSEYGNENSGFRLLNRDKKIAIVTIRAKVIDIHSKISKTPIHIHILLWDFKVQCWSCDQMSFCRFLSDIFSFQNIKNWGEHKMKIFQSWKKRCICVLTCLITPNGMAKKENWRNLECLAFFTNW